MGLNDDPNLELLLKLDEQSGGTAYDTSSNAWDATLSGVSFTTDKTTGKIDGGLSFTTSGDGMTIGDHALGDVDQTYAAWIRIDTAISTSAFIFSTRDGTQGCLSFALINSSGSTIAAYVGPTFLAQYTDTGLDDAEWHHVALVYDSSPTPTLYFYIDGKLVHTSRILTSTEIRGLANNPYGKGLNDDPNLELHLKLDEAASATTAVDSSPRGNDGSVVGGASIDFAATGKFGNCITRTETGDNINCGVLGLTEESDQTISAWFRWDTGTTGFWALSCRDGTVGGLSLNIVSTTQIRCHIGATAQAIITVPTMTTGTWYHLAVVYDYVAGTIDHYHNGVYKGQDATLSDTWEDPATIDTILFERDGGTASSDASMDDVRIYSRALTASEVRALYYPYGVGLDDDPNLEVLFKFDETTGSSVALDSGPRGNDGTLNQLDFSTDSVPGVYENALARIVVNDRIELGDLELTEGVSQTVACWMRWDNSDTSTGYMYSTRDTDAGGLTLYLSPTADQQIAYIGTAAQTTRGTVTTMDDGNWHHHAMVYDAEALSITFYYDGAQVGQDTTLSVGAWTEGMNTQIFEREEGTSAFDVTCDDWRLYSRALSINEIWQLIRSYGRGLNNDPDLLAHLKLDGDIDDATGNYSATTLVGTPVIGSAFVTGVHDQGITRDASGSFRIDGDASLSLDTFTISCWLKVASAPTALMSIIGKYDLSGDDRQFNIYLDNSPSMQLLYTTKNGSVIPTKQGTTVLSVDTWHHIAFTVDNGTDGWGYVDGLVDHTTVLDVSPGFAYGPDHLQCSVGGNIATEMDDVRYYSRVLTPAEIHQLYRDSYSVSLYANKKKTRMVGV
jgi:hypothetical protein